MHEVTVVTVQLVWSASHFDQEPVYLLLTHSRRGSPFPF